jgi:hypothetical protein
VAEPNLTYVEPRPGGTRAEHLAWAKQRALEYVDAGDLTSALASFFSDLRKHDELRDHGAIELGGLLMFGGHMTTAHEVRDLITGSN